MFRNNSNFLRYTVEKKIKENHREICLTKSQMILERFKSLVSGKGSWIAILATVASIILLSQLVGYIPFLRIIDFEDNTTANLIELRISNIATITSITLVVVGFLINNLALKSPLTFELLFKKLYLYSTIYLILISIGVFVILSTLKDSQDLFNSYNNAVLASTYIMIVVLFVIGYLFKTIVTFADERVILRLLKNQLFNEAKENLIIALINKYSRERYIEIVEEAGAEMFVFGEYLELSEEGGHIRYIHDINTKRLSNYIRKKIETNNTRVLFQTISLQSRIKSTDAFVWQEGFHNDRDTLKLQKCLYLRKTINERQNKYKSYFESEFKDSVSKSNFVKVDEILSSLRELYIMEQRHLN